MYMLAAATTEKKGVRPFGPDLEWAMPMLLVLHAQSRSFVAGMAGIGPRSATLQFIGSTGNFAHDEGTALWRQALQEVEGGDYAAAHRSMRRVLAWDESVGLGPFSSAETLNALAYLELEQQLFLDAERTAQSALEAVTAQVGDDLAPRTLQWMRAKYYSATASWGQGMLQEAADAYKQVAQAVRSAYGRHHVLYATALTEFCYIKEEIMVEQMLNKCVEEEDAMVERCVLETDGSGCHDGSFLAPGCDPSQLQLSAAERTLALLDKAVVRWNRVENYRLNLDWQHLSKRRQLMATRVKVAATASPVERGMLSFILEREHSWRSIRSLYHSVSEAVVRMLSHTQEPGAALQYAKASLGVMSDHLNGAWSRGVLAPTGNNMMRTPVQAGPHAFDVPGARGEHMPLRGEQLMRALHRLHAGHKPPRGKASACKVPRNTPGLQKWVQCAFPATALSTHMTNGSLVEPRNSLAAAPMKTKGGLTGAWALPKQTFRAPVQPAAFWGGEGLVGDVYNFLERVAPSAQLSPHDQADQLLRRCRSARVQDTSLLYVQVGFMAQGNTVHPPAQDASGGLQDALSLFLPGGGGNGPAPHSLHTQVMSSSQPVKVLDPSSSGVQTTGGIFMQALLGSAGGVLANAEAMFAPKEVIASHGVLMPPVGPSAAVEGAVDASMAQIGSKAVRSDGDAHCETDAAPNSPAPEVHGELQPLTDRMWAALHALPEGKPLLQQQHWDALVSSKSELASLDNQHAVAYRKLHVQLLQSMAKADQEGTVALCKAYVTQAGAQGLADTLATWHSLREWSVKELDPTAPE